MAGAIVTATDPQPDEVATTSAADGTFRLDALRAGGWRVRAESPASGPDADVTLLPDGSLAGELLLPGGRERPRSRPRRATFPPDSDGFDDLDECLLGTDPNEEPGRGCGSPAPPSAALLPLLLLVRARGSGGPGSRSSRSGSAPPAS